MFDLPRTVTGAQTRAFAISLGACLCRPFGAAALLFGPVLASHHRLLADALLLLPCVSCKPLLAAAGSASSAASCTPWLTLTAAASRAACSSTATTCGAAAAGRRRQPPTKPQQQLQQQAQDSRADQVATQSPARGAEAAAA
jgi:hypothetical protein